MFCVLIEMRFLFKVKNQEILEIQLKKGKKVIDKEHLTTGQPFDIMLIRALDKILRKNKIGRLSLKSVEISGKTDPKAAFSMILRTVARAWRHKAEIEKLRN